LTQRRIIVAVDGGTPQGFPMPAAVVAAAARIVTAAAVLTVFVIAAGVDRPEAGCGQGGEHLGVLDNGGGHVVVSAVQAGVHELPGVAGIQVRAGRARDRAAVVAAGPHLMRPAEGVGADQVDGVGAEPDVFGFLPPGLEAR
jgi:hypothetical protein